MTSNQPVQSADEIEDRAAHFLARRRYTDWRADDQTELEAWLAEAMSHRVAFWRLEATLARTERLAALRPRNAVRIAPQSSRSSSRFHLVAALGAAVATIIAGIYFIAPSQTTYSTPIGGHEVLKLADGSVIELNTDTILRLKSGERSAVLEKGEAYFQIKHDPARPFTVETSSHRVVDIGTKFLIRNDSGRFEVSLIEGLARVEPAQTSSGTASTLLKPGDVAIGQGGTLKVMRKRTSLVERELGWRRGMLVFDNTTLSAAAAEFNRYNRTKLLIADPAAGRLLIGAAFPANDVERFARSARVLLGVNVTRRDGDIVISR